MVAPLVDEGGDQGGPTCLMRSTQARAVVTVEVLVEEDQIIPVRVILEGVLSPMNGTAAGRRVAREYVDQPLGDRSRHLAECDRLAPRAWSGYRVVGPVRLGQLAE